MDMIDPRIFLILPEHISNAHHVWNCALFITQMSNLDSLNANNNSLANQSAHSKNLIATSNNSSKLSTNTFSFESIINDFKSNQVSANKSDENSSGSEQEFYKLFNEPIQRIFKIKKRNKASLYNLIFPFNSSSSSEQREKKDKAIAMADLHNLTTPWMLLKQHQQLNGNNSSQMIEPVSNSANNTSNNNNNNNNANNVSDCESVSSEDKATSNNCSANNSSSMSSCSSSSSSSSSSASELEIDLNLNDGCKR